MSGLFPLVTIIIPTRDGTHLLRRCVESILSLTDYPSWDLILIDNQSSKYQTLQFLDAMRSNSRTRVLRYDAPFNYSGMNNYGVGEANGELVALLNDDVEVVSPGWLKEMVAHAVNPKIGAVGAKLFYPDYRIQHAGVALGIDKIAGHPYKFERHDSTIANGALHTVRRCSAVTGACLVVRKCLYEEVQGLDAKHLPVAYNDVDFCLRLSAAGYENIWTPQAELIHHEASTRGKRDTLSKKIRHFREISYMKRRWGRTLDSDPFYSANHQ